ncbi:polysaccharide biosynthesis protein [Desulfovibrio subterraneus]|uniref:SDR family NAD(P)-dependent oxidoreductase n=1 Tax=Desulfovibrio subterraneus TaxID=2718620 RepID=UPI0022B8F4D3|nr:SDR family NAD(P)-dependent oxidoreductase [Desulfovibrio subterraneus]WBF66277.1 polysaccharide biosynthesis protein [Desulfovibrio subterraneus]
MKPNNTIDGKRILITGACGTIGSELVDQLIRNHNPHEVLCIDNNETALFFLEQKLQHHANVHFQLVDIRERESLRTAMSGIDTIFHTAAFKHVILCERSPFEAVQNNIIGVQNIVQSSIASGVSTVVFTSSDKAVNPTNVMGTSKLMGERLITSANATQKIHKTTLVSTRFGNVMGSRGSVVPIFHKQIKEGKAVTVTDTEMTRFIMSIKRAVQLVIDSATMACGGEVFITKMPVLRIYDLAKVMINKLAPIYDRDPSSVPIEIIGAKPGEKMYEELMTIEETRRAVELDDYFVVTPAFRNVYQNLGYEYPNVISDDVKKPYHSGHETPMTDKEIYDFLSQLEISGFCEA